VAYDRLKPGDIVVLDLEGRVLDGCRSPSSEWALHAALYRSRPAIGAVVHTHSPYATTLACLHWELPAIHYLVAYAGARVPLVPYADFGSAELAAAVVRGLAKSDAALLANHGLVAVAATLPRAFEVAEQIEFAAQLYYMARAAGEPALLSEEQMSRAVAAIRRYGPAAAQCTRGAGGRRSGTG
jgi:L-fuculose-phosphate aldolase